MTNLISHVCIMATDTSEIYKKKHHTKKKQNNITGFGIAIVVSLAIAFLWTILGTNFTYITHLAVSKLNILFPTDPTKEPYTEASNSKPMKGGGECTPKISIVDGDFGYKYSFPYNTVNEEHVFGFLGRWLSQVSTKSNIWLRHFLINMSTKMGKLCETLPTGYSDVLLFNIGPIIIPLLLILPFVWFLPTLVACFKSMPTNNLLFSAAGLLFGWTYLTSFFINLVQFVDMMWTFLFFPLMYPYVWNSPIYKEIISQNKGSISLILLLSIAISAFMFLKIELAGSITFMFVAYLIKHYYF